MDDLESELFSSTLKKFNVSTSLKSARNSSFHDFDEDDPLGDILSSSNESSPREKSATHEASNAENETEKLQTKNKVIANLFGLDEPEQVSSISTVQNDSKAPSKNPDPSDWLGLKSEPEVPLERYSTKTRRESITDVSKASKTPRNIEKSMTNASGSLTSNVKLESTTADVHQSTESSKKSNTAGSVLQELLGKAVISSQKPPSESKQKESILDTFITSEFDNKTPVSSGFKESSNVSNSPAGRLGYIPSPGQESRSRRGTQRKAATLTDPLGLFASTDSARDIPGIQPQASRTNTTSLDFATATSSQPSKYSDQKPSWLGSHESASVAPILQPSTSTPIPGSSSAKTDNPNLPLTPVTDTEAPINEKEVLKNLSTLEMQVGEAAAQQQKSLISALALKRQEDLLLQLQSQHATLLSQHEQQLSALVQRQFQRQKQMIQQQELIQAHIEALVTQPPQIVPITLPEALLRVTDKSTGFTESHPDKDQSKIEKENIVKIAELEDHIQKLKNENSDLKSTLASQRQRYEEQLNEMETMYRKSLAVQEEAFQNQAARSQSEREEIEREVTFRINRLKEDHTVSSQQQAERMAELHSEWLADLRRLGEFHRQAVEMLRSEQTSTLEHWKNLQSTEIASIKEANVHSRLLQTAVNDLNESTSCFQQLKEQFSKEIHSLLDSKKEDLHKEEDHLTDLTKMLEKQAAALEAERSRMNMLTQDLEARLIQQRQEADDDRQRFDAREKEWVKEKASAVKYLEREKQYLEKLQFEARTELAYLEKQKINLAKEVARLETTLHLQEVNASRNTQQAEEMVAEAKATLQAAQEAGREIEKEREELEALKKDLLTERHHLAAIEKEVKAKEAQIQKETQHALASRNEGLSALEEARRLERERTEHASDLAQRLLHLKERENNLAKEKLAVTLEWKRIQEYRETATCARCGQVASESSTSFNKPQDIVDPLPIIMKLEAEQDLDYATPKQTYYLPTLLESISQ